MPAEMQSGSQKLFQSVLLRAIYQPQKIHISLPFSSTQLHHRKEISFLPTMFLHSQKSKATITITSTKTRTALSMRGERKQSKKVKSFGTICRMMQLYCGFSINQQRKPALYHSNLRSSLFSQMNFRKHLECCHRLKHWANTTAHPIQPSYHTPVDFHNHLRCYEPVPRKMHISDQNQLSSSQISRKSSSKLPSFTHIKSKIDTGLQRKALGQISNTVRFDQLKQSKKLLIDEKALTALMESPMIMNSIGSTPMIHTCNRNSQIQTYITGTKSSTNGQQKHEILELASEISPFNSQHCFPQKALLQKNQQKLVQKNIQNNQDQQDIPQKQGQNMGKRFLKTQMRLSIRRINRNFREVFAKGGMQQLIQALSKSGRINGLSEQGARQYLQKHLNQLLN